MKILPNTFAAYYPSAPVCLTCSVAELTFFFTSSYAVDVFPTVLYSQFLVFFFSARNGRALGLVSWQPAPDIRSPKKSTHFFA